ncbi:hypothetical protein [Natrinema salaciae]|uniref:Uncharacterized protein n=1 Tax=Natrinema salaciae TaxID=1186196 RepID=A0A1H9JMQ6_9EURY|nr:hypothetical protein [Natrinema salaciae]SEQ88106.1 hypothetical protein SAMN04489841_2621 [Natrinema salaciae]
MPSNEDRRQDQGVAQESVSRRQVLGSVGAGASTIGGMSGSAFADSGKARADDNRIKQLERKRSEFQSAEAVEKIARSRARPLVTELVERGLIQTDQPGSVIPTEPVPMERYVETDEGVVVTAEVTEEGDSARVQFKTEIEGTQLLVAVLPHQDRQYAVIGEGKDSVIADQDRSGDFTTQSCVVGSVCYWRPGFNTAERELHCCYGSQGEPSSCYWGSWGRGGCHPSSDGPCCEFCDWC